MLPARDKHLGLASAFLALAGCGPLADAPAVIPEHAACSTIAQQQLRCATLAPVSVAAIQSECNQLYAGGDAFCAEAIEAFARCLPGATCKELHALTSACTELAGDMATRCGPTLQAQNSNTAQSRSHLF